MADPVNDTPASPTGTPKLIPPWAVPYVTVGWAIATAIVGFLLIKMPSNGTVQYIAGFMVALAPILGLVSPGWRSAAKALAVLLLLGATLNLSACTFFKPIVPALEKCGTDAVAKLVPAFTQDIQVILSGAAPDWASQLDTLIAAGGDAAVCAFFVVLNQLETGIPLAQLDAAHRAKAGPIGPATQLTRTQSYRIAHFK